MQEQEKHIMVLLFKKIQLVATLAGGNGSSTATNYLTTIGLSGKTLKQGALITVPYEETIKNLTLTSGSVIAYSA
jgi:hypothetical protein